MSKNISSTSAIPILNTMLPISLLLETYPSNKDKQSKDNNKQSKDNNVSNNKEGKDKKKVIDTLIIIDSTNVLGNKDLRLEDITTQLDRVEIKESEDLEDSRSI